MHVKRQVFAVALAIQCFATAAGAVSIDRVGVKAGASWSQMRLDPQAYGSSEWHAGAVGGPFVLADLSRHFAVQPAVVYAERGGSYRDLPSTLWGGDAIVAKLDAKRTYLELPVLFRYRPWTEGSVEPALILGPACGWVLSSENLEDGYAYPDQSGKHDWAIVVGLGMARRSDGAILGVDITYRRALTGLGNEAAADPLKADGVDAVVWIGF